MWGIQTPRRFYLSQRETLRGEPSFFLCTPPAGGTVEKTERQPLAAVSRNGCVPMADYHEMYLNMARANAKAVNILIQAQQECEEMYMSSPDPEIQVLDPKNRPAPQ